ncbi:hypothetical protein CMQ_4389 [Grosmannia clavigera kw1407]|uniref:Uncharacterized protein n=1 Tax=Grosmannia clavigera (strain kw1407 / UAMH 11150) TaxID=655863 RepID=F0XTK2_GROCL|nr:uncharacterized protein CMQ_4389 [Grosmannia clavigera kw1407]EFW98537.1 hypothetical protein CMQ_4389 [Grosmannia clavigera kw1407]
MPEFVEDPTPVFGLGFPSRVMARSSSTTTCIENSNENLCEKPAANTGITIPVVLGCVNMKKLRSEDQNDAHKSWDFGMTMNQAGVQGARPKRKSVFGLNGEKTPGQRQLSIDMNLSSPYLLPPEIHNSRDTLSTLARSIHENEDPYRPVTSYGASDGASLRSYQKDTRAKSPGVPPPYPDKETQPFSVAVPKSSLVKDSFAKETMADIDSVKKSRFDNSVTVTELQIPATAASRLSQPSTPVSPRPRDLDLPKLASPQSEAGEELFIYDKPAPVIHDDARNRADSVPNSRSNHQSSAGQFAFNVTSIPDMPQDDGELRLAGPQQSQEDRGRAQHRRQSSEYPPEEGAAQPSGLDLPRTENRRLSVGFRPLPPDEIIESEDPETRANRIRSFYKEYFEDSKPDMAEYNQHYPPNGLPAQYRNAAAKGGPQSPPNPSDSGAYFDPNSNTFVMPYAQPVSRRAMTPPPSGSRFPAGGRPRFGPGHHGSLGGMSPGMRPGSSASNIRSGSSLGPRPSPGPRKPAAPLAPPPALLTLPTPSKLTDDGLSLLGAIDFAPPPTIAEHVSGRPQSPMGERRPYQMKVPASSPLVSAFEEMAVLPSPHVLRKSSTFTGLDFAPPRKFKDPDVMSDAGSIRSNRSGISAAQQVAIRNGAGRISRLPEDTIFTPAAMADQLKPSWNLRT